jgi:DNA-binding NtrC family response regulator
MASATVTGGGMVLVADDQADVLEALRLLLKPEGYAVDTVETPAAVMGAVSQRDYDVVLIDLNYARDTTSGEEGLGLLERLRDFDTTLPVVVMTAFASIELVVEAMRRGARDFVPKPWENARLLAILRTQSELGRALRQSRRLTEQNRLLSEAEAPAFISESATMRPVLDMIKRIGPSDAAVLITGESGVGKGTIARALHAASQRADRSLLTVNAGGLSEGVFESELLGHVRGAFTDAKSDRPGRFELADGGTLFLDEIANVPLNLQPKLLRVLETGEFERVGSSRTRKVDVRVISATNADLGQEVVAGRFRQDLLFRLNTIEIHVPPLRERTEDLEPLARHFVAQHARRYRKAAGTLAAPTLEALRRHSWPGNVRELDHAIERAVLMTRGDEIVPADLVLRPEAGGRERLEDLSLEEVERVLIKKALEKHEGNVSRAAEVLGLSRSALYRRLQRFGL